MTRDELIEMTAKHAFCAANEVDAEAWVEWTDKQPYLDEAEYHIEAMTTLCAESTEAREAVCREIGVGAVIIVGGDGCPEGEYLRVRTSDALWAVARLVSTRPDQSEDGGTDDG